MNSLPPRQQDIFDLARREGRVDVVPLAAHFDVSVQTIRKDLNDLCDADRLHRVHGGAVFPSNTVNLDYLARRQIASDGKAKIGELVAKVIPDGASVILNIGTTTEQVAHALLRHRELLVITNNLHVAQILSVSSDIELILAGGSVRKLDGGILGAAAVDMIRQFKVDYAIVGTSAIDEQGALLDFDYQEVRVAQAILDQSRKKILVADHTKMERRAAVQIGHLADMDMFVTDKALPESIAGICQENDVEITIVDDR